MTTTDRLKNFPPCLVRMMARHRYGKPLTDKEIGQRSITISRHVYSYSWRTDWDTINTTDAIAFLHGCGLDIDDTKAWRRAIDYISKRPTFRHLRISGHWDAYYLPLMTSWRLSYGTVTPASPIWPPLRSLLIRLNPLLK